MPIFGTAAAGFDCGRTIRGFSGVPLRRSLGLSFRPMPSAGLTDALGVTTNIELSIGGPHEIYFHPDAPRGDWTLATC